MSKEGNELVRIHKSNEGTNHKKMSKYRHDMTSVQTVLPPSRFLRQLIHPPRNNQILIGYKELNETIRVSVILFRLVFLALGMHALQPSTADDLRHVAMPRMSAESTLS